MASNPMQRKTRNAFLLGFLLMLVLAIFIGVAAYMLIVKPMIDEEKQEELQTYAVYRLAPGFNVKSGEEITSAMVEAVDIPVTEDRKGDLIAAGQ